MTWWALLLGCGASTDPGPVSEPPPAIEAPRERPAPLLRTVEVWFFDVERLRDGGDPLVARAVKVEPGDRRSVAQAVVDAVFAGPDEEGLRTVSNGATGGTVQLDGRVATVVLEGDCRGAGAQNVHEQLVKSLRGLEGIAHVRTVDPGGKVPPSEVTGHRAECLEP